jgi:hypothetical protein
MPMKSILLLPESMHKCHLGAGTSTFPIGFKRESIKTESTRCALVFYSSEQDASLGLNELEKTIHFRFPEHFTFELKMRRLYGTGQFDIIVEPTPK